MADSGNRDARHEVRLALMQRDAQRERDEDIGRDGEHRERERRHPLCAVCQFILMVRSLRNGERKTKKDEKRTHNLLPQPRKGLEHEAPRCCLYGIRGFRGSMSVSCSEELSRLGDIDQSVPIPNAIDDVLVIIILRAGMGHGLLT